MWALSPPFERFPLPPLPSLCRSLKKTATGPAGPLGLYAGFGVSVVGIVPFRGTYFGVNDTLNM